MRATTSILAAMIVLSLLAGTATNAEPSKEEATRQLEEKYGDVSVNTMAWTLNPPRPDDLKLFIAAGFPATSKLKLEEGDHVIEFSLLQYILQFACDSEETAQVVQVLVDNGVELNEPAPNGNTPLMQAIQCDRVIGILLRAGADPNVTNERGETALSRALFWQSPDETVRLLIDAGADVRGDQERLKKLASRQDSSMKKRLIEEALAKPDPAAMKDWEVRKAVAERKTDVIREYLEAKPEAAQRIDDKPALFVVTERCSKEEDPEAVVAMLDLFLEKGAEVNARSETLKETPLHVAARQCRGAVVKRLVDAGAMVDVKNMADQTPLFFAVFADNAEAVDVLLDVGAKVDGNTKFFAKNKPEIWKLFKEKR